MTILSRKRIYVALSMIALSAGALIVFSSNRCRDGWRFKANYERLALGHPFSEVLDMMGSQPDYEYQYASFRIAYYRAPSIFRGDTDMIGYAHGQVVATLEELPYLYDCVQLAFNSNNVLVAYTWIGETYTVEAIGGSVKGSHLSALGTLGTTGSGL
jgi:hypothetical protein